VHIVLGDLEPCALCNATNFDGFAMISPRYEIEPLEYAKLGANTEKHVYIIEIGMGSYKIEDVDLFASIKDLE